MHPQALPKTHWNKFLSSCWFAAFFVAIAGSAHADEETQSTSEDDSQAIRISGVFEAAASQEFSADTEHTTSLKIKRIVSHGAKIREGQNIVWFDTEDIDKKIEQAEIDLRLSKLSLEDADFSHQQFLATQKIDREAARRARKEAQQDYDNFVQTDRDHQIVSAEFQLKSSQASLENSLEELEQLQQMYEEDDLTEKSEEIVLKRAKQDVEYAQFRLDGTKIQSDRSINQSIPRSKAKQEESLARAELTFQTAIRDFASARQKREIELERKRDKFKDEQEKLTELKAERKRFVLTAPFQGIVLHGELTRGKLGDKPSTFEPGTKVAAEKVVATIVNPEQLRIRVDLAEKHLGTVQPGETCKVKVNGFPRFETTGKVRSVSSVPYANGKFDCVVKFRTQKDQPLIMPTMGCELEFESHKATGDVGKHDKTNRDKTKRDNVKDDESNGDEKQ